ncbi:Ulp1 family isopeptidase [Bradyrhizobium barranii subsp. apii]|uniref:Ulp1 family isopeptidase n=1 Tax=Bradyrhizobium barranii subsp. apii TaxID=2819348 RepID=A0A8T5VMF6_9BRAD|nr:Ulp1 family isopeptidase [Bradyrhizobium barranii]UPT88781.1 Ulp1 family isopeptidase [Bradyrhizobium barranii subsp. apii]
MNFVLMNRVRQQTDSVDAQDASPADSSAEAAAFHRQLSEVAVPSSPVLMQVRAHQADASRSEARPIMRASGQPYTPATHGECGGAMLNASALPLGHANLAFAGSSMDPVYSEDASLIEGLGPALFKAGASERTVRRNVRCLLGLGHWLVKNGKPGIAARLSEESLDKDAQEFGKQEGQAIATPLDHLRAAQSPGGIAPIASRVELNPYPQDADLIKRYKEDAASGTANTVRTYAALLIDFSDYLRENDKPGIAARLGDGSLDNDVSQYKEADPRGRRKAGAALAHLLRSPAGARAIELRPHIRPVPDLEDAVRAEPRRTRAATAQHSGSNGAISWPETLPANQQDLLLETMDGPSSSPPLETIAHHQQAADAGGSFRDLNLPRDDHGVPPRHSLALDPAESLRPLNWRHHDHELSDERHRNTLVPGEQVLISDEHDTGELRSAKRQKTLSNPQGVAVERHLVQTPSHQLAASPSQRQAPMPSRAHEYAPAAHSVARHVRDTARRHDASRDAVRNQLSVMVEGGPSWSVLVPPERLQGAEQAGPQEPAGSTSTWSPQMPLDFDWSMWPSSETASSLPVPAQLPSRSYQLRDDATFRNTLNTFAPESLRSSDGLIGEQLPGEDEELLAKFRVDAERRKLTPGAIKNSVSGLGIFVRWVNASHRGPVASRLRGGSSLDEEIAAYRSLGRDRQNSIKSNLNVLRRLLRGSEEAEAPEPRVLGRPRRVVPHPEDATFIEGALGQALNDLRTTIAAQRQSAQKRATRLRALSAWLKENGRGSITGRLNGSSKEQLTLDNDVLAFQRTGSRIHGPDLSHLRSYLKLIEANRGLGLPGPEQPSSPAAQCDRHSGSAQDLPSTPASAGAWAWLGEQLQESASPSRPPSHAKGRLEPSVDLNAPTPSELRDDAHLEPAQAARARSSTYAGLEPFLALNAPTPSELRDDAHFAPAHSTRAPSDIYAGLEPFLALNAPTPSELRDDAHSAPAHSTRAPSDIYAGLEPFLDLNAPTPSELRDDAHFAPAHSTRAPSDIYAGLEPFLALNAPTPSELRDDAHFAPAHSTRAPSDIYAGLEPFLALNAPTPSELRDDAHSAPAHSTRAPSDIYAGLEPFLDLNAPTPSELRDDAHFAPAHSTRAPSDIYAGLEPFLALNAPTPSELRDDAHFEPAQAARARSSTYGGPPLVDLTAATPSESRDDVNSVPAFPSTSYDAQIGALGPTASSHGRGLVLEGTEWLGDEHVLRDYQLLAQELRGNNPNLAARTRFVDPLITLVSLRLGTESEMLRAFQRIVHDQNGDDTADFLFLPVNNARATNLPGTHWSLLFVDRRDRERPVAYRYDSMGEYNNRPAAELAARLGARLESRGMTQQLNTYDCGVFVVDGTRALVRQLEQGRAPHLLNLSSLVANRQALQNRLRG